MPHVVPSHWGLHFLLSLKRYQASTFYKVKDETTIFQNANDEDYINIFMINISTLFFYSKLLKCVLKSTR